MRFNVIVVACPFYRRGLSINKIVLLRVGRYAAYTYGEMLSRLSRRTIEQDGHIARFV